MRLYTVFVFHFHSFTFLNICIRASQNGFPGTKPHTWHSAYANKENLLTTAAEQAVVSGTNLVVPPRVACRAYKYRKCIENTTQHFRNDDVTLHVRTRRSCNLTKFETASATQYLRAHGDPYSCHDRMTNTFLSFMVGKLECIPKLLYENIPRGRGKNSVVRPRRRETSTHEDWTSH